MATFKRFEEIEAWRKARELVKEIYLRSNEAGFSRDFGLRDQQIDGILARLHDQGREIQILTLRG